jgi:hypothetical protein
MDEKRQMAVAREALRLLAERCPRLVGLCYWAGTASVAIEDLQHRQSFDLDFHTRAALQDVRPILAEIQKAFPGRFELVRASDEFGSGFSGVLELPEGDRITIEVLANYEDVHEDELEPSVSAPPLRRVSLRRYLADKIQCVVERAEARDLVDIMAVLERRPEMEADARRFLGEQDALLLAERLLAWTDESLVQDLAAYDDVEPAIAGKARDMLLRWVHDTGAEGR